MKTYKKWVLILLSVLIVFIGINAAVWNLYTKEILTFKKYYNGGLDRMGYIIGSKHYRNPEFTLPRKHMNNADYHGQNVDVVTIGDSFSNVKDNGLNPLYQDWIASLYNLDVLNVQPLPGANELTTVLIMLNSGYLDKVKPRFLVLEKVERNCLREFCAPVDMRMTRPLTEVEAFFKTAGFIDNPPDVGFINTGNVKFLLNSLLYKFSDRAFFSPVYIRDLNRPFFSVKNDRRLLFYYGDLAHLPYINIQTVTALNETINGLADLLRKKGIALYFMPAADKYNMYSQYIVDNPYGKSLFFELLRQLPKRYVFVDTKAILIDEIHSGEKDIYYADDTHWSWKAVKKIAENMRF